MEAAPRKHRRRRRLAIATGVFAALLAVWWVAFLIRCHSAEKALQAALSQLRERGEPTTLGELLEMPQRQPNGAADLMRAILLSGGETANAVARDQEVEANVKALCGEMPEIGKSLVLSEDRISWLKPTPNPPMLDLEAVDLALPRLNNLLRKSVEAPAGRLTVRPGRELFDRIPRSILPDMRQILSILFIDVDRSVNLKKPRRAWESLTLMSKLGGTLAEEPSRGVFLERVPIAFSAVHLLGSAIGGGPPQDEDYDRLDDVFARWRSCPPIAALRGEFFAVMQMLDASSTEELRRKLLPQPFTFQTDHRYYTWWARRYHFTSPLGRADRLDEQRQCAADFEAARGWIERRLRSTSNGAKELPPSRPATFPLPDGNLSQRFQLLAAAWERLDAASFIARTALRVDRFRRIRGRLPENLHQAFEATSPLDSQFSLEPQDWLGGFRVIYRRTETGFSLDDPTMANGGAKLKLSVKYGSKSLAPK